MEMSNQADSRRLTFYMPLNFHASLKEPPKELQWISLISIANGLPIEHVANKALSFISDY